MATYAIGDIQGCYDELQSLLEKLKFEPGRDTLWLTGDLVNRGPKSLEALRFVKELGDDAITVLGNHDLHLLALYFDKKHPLQPDPSLLAILQAPDRDELLDWLRRRPLLHHDPELGYVLIHAGLPPQWDLEKAQACATEVQETLSTPDFLSLLENMYGNEPWQWTDDLQGMERHRFIINCFTRMRYCTPEGKLEFRHKGAPGSQPPDYLPWFEVKDRNSAGMEIIFGHWSTLGIQTKKGIHALDSGCLWGGTLTALCLEDGKILGHDCQSTCNP